MRSYGQIRHESSRGLTSSFNRYNDKRQWCEAILKYFHCGSKREAKETHFLGISYFVIKKIRLTFITINGTISKVSYYEA